MDGRRDTQGRQGRQCRVQGAVRSALHLLWRVHAVRRAARVDLLSLDVQGAEPIAAASLGGHISYGVVMAEVEVGTRRIDTMRAMLDRGFHYVGQISARPSPDNYIISDVWFNRSHFARFWPQSRVLFV